MLVTNFINSFFFFFFFFFFFIFFFFFFFPYLTKVLGFLITLEKSIFFFNCHWVKRFFINFRKLIFFFTIFQKKRGFLLPAKYTKLIFNILLKIWWNLYLRQKTIIIKQLHYLLTELPYIIIAYDCNILNTNIISLNLYHYFYFSYQTLDTSY